MRAEKKIISKEYASRLNASPFFIVIGYQGLKVAHMTELRKRLNKVGSEVHVVKNSIFRLAVQEAGVGELNGSLAGQVAVVTGQKEVSASAKVLKSFGAEFDKLAVRFGYLNNKRLEQADLMQLADLPSIEVLRANLLRVIHAPAQKLVTMINTPATQLAQVIRARVDKGG